MPRNPEGDGQFKFNLDQDPEPDDNDTKDNEKPIEIVWDDNDDHWPKDRDGSPKPHGLTDRIH